MAFGKRPHCWVMRFHNVRLKDKKKLLAMLKVIMAFMPC